MGSAPKLGCVHPKTQTALVSHALLPFQGSVTGSLWLLLLLVSPVRAVLLQSGHHWIGDSCKCLGMGWVGSFFYPSADNALRVKKKKGFRITLSARSIYLFRFYAVMAPTSMAISWEISWLIW